MTGQISFLLHQNPCRLGVIRLEMLVLNRFVLGAAVVGHSFLLFIGFATSIACKRVKERAIVQGRSSARIDATVVLEADADQCHALRGELCWCFHRDRRHVVSPIEPEFLRGWQHDLGWSVARVAQVRHRPAPEPNPDAHPIGWNGRVQSVSSAGQITRRVPQTAPPWLCSRACSILSLRARGASTRWLPGSTPSHIRVESDRTRDESRPRGVRHPGRY